MRWKSNGNSAAGRCPYFSESLSIASWTMSSAASSSRTANIACLNARRSTLSRNAESSARDARVRPPPVPDVIRRQMLPSWFFNAFCPRTRMDRVKTTTLTGAEIVVRCLQEEGVEYVFGYPGGAVLFIYDELFKQDKVKHVLVRHEQGAAHAADGYSRASNKVAVCLVTSGPGLTNAATGIATAYMDSIPMVILVGQVPTHPIRLDAFQEAATVGITRPPVK